MMHQRAMDGSVDGRSGRAADTDSDGAGTIGVESVEVQVAGNSSLIDAVADTVSDFVEQSEEEWRRMRGTIGPF